MRLSLETMALRIDYLSGNPGWQNYCVLGFQSRRASTSRVEQTAMMPIAAKNTGWLLMEPRGTMPR